MKTIRTTCQISEISYKLFYLVLAPELCSISAFKLVDGDIVRAYDYFAGELTKDNCRLHCGCNNFAYAAYDPLGFCFCGNSLEEPDCNDGYCWTVSS